MVQAAERLQMRWFDAAAVHALMRSYLLRTPKLSFYHATMCRRQAALPPPLAREAWTSGAAARSSGICFSSYPSSSTRARASSVSCSAVVRSARAAQATRTCSRATSACAAAGDAARLLPAALVSR